MSETRDINSLVLHPDAAKVPMAAGDDLARLRESLREHGQQDPIDVTPEDVVLDGRTRLSLLRELGARTIGVRVVDVPLGQQTDYIVHRALDRRHLTMDQKRVLNDLLRRVVVETFEHPKTGEEVRVGLSRPQRAAKLGVTPATVKRWDIGSGSNDPDQPTPTHVRREGGNTSIKPLPAPAPRVRVPAKPPAHVAPPWLRHFTLWCRRARPEDIVFLRRMDTEIHEAMTHIESTWQKGN